MSIEAAAREIADNAYCAVGVRHERLGHIEAALRKHFMPADADVEAAGGKLSKLIDPNEANVGIGTKELHVHVTRSKSVSRRLAHVLPSEVDGFPVRVDYVGKIESAGTQLDSQLAVESKDARLALASASPPAPVANMTNTEADTDYTREEIEELVAVCKRHGHKQFYSFDMLRLLPQMLAMMPTAAEARELSKLLGE